jgi:hypothetical protein
MNFEIFFKILGSIALIVLGIMAKYSSNDGWSSSKKYWPYFIIVGLLSLALNIYKYW